MPWIAFVPDISGVCSVFGHLRDHLEADEAGKHEDREIGHEHHAASTVFLAPSWTIWPSRVMHAPAMISSSTVEFRGQGSHPRRLEQQPTSDCTLRA